MKKIVAIIIFTIMLFPIVAIIINNLKREYDCMSPEEIDRRCRKYDEYWEVTWSQ